ncbi:mediator complex, subunit Med21 [Bisporella sp. PMI_857]|nr:mediator complex, subunit Med21 [Bisporella sp. PMI_857]
MADRLSQLQEAVDDFANQSVAALYHVIKHHDYKKLSVTDAIREEIKKDGEPEKLPEIEPQDADVFRASQKELSRDLIIKEQQIEYLVSVLPGLTNSEKEQEETIRQLEKELQAEEIKRRRAVKERDAALAKLENVIRSIQRP